MESQCRLRDRQLNGRGAPQGKETDFDPCFHSDTPPLAPETADVEALGPGLPSMLWGRVTQGLGVHPAGHQFGGLPHSGILKTIFF